MADGQELERDESSPPEPQSIEPAAPEQSVQVQLWWRDGKDNTTAALGIVLRATGHGYRAHVLQFTKGGAASADLDSPTTSIHLPTAASARSWWTRS